MIWNTFRLRLPLQELVNELPVLLEGEEHETKAPPKRRKRASPKANMTKEKVEEIVPGRTIVPSSTTLA